MALESLPVAGRRKALRNAFEGGWRGINFGLLPVLAPRPQRCGCGNEFPHDAIAEAIASKTFTNPGSQGCSLTG